MGCKRLLYCISTFACSAFSRNAAPVADMLKPSLSAMRSNSAFTTGFTHTVSLTVFRLGVGLFCERELFLSVSCARIMFLSDAGCVEAMRAREGRGLSCLTPLRGCWPFGE